MEHAPKLDRVGVVDGAHGCMTMAKNSHESK
jgi:hypothetical protein